MKIQSSLLEYDSASDTYHGDLSALGLREGEHPLSLEIQGESPLNFSHTQAAEGEGDYKVEAAFIYSNHYGTKVKPSSST